MKIFEIIEYSDGGPNDRGFVFDYIKTNQTLEELRATRKHGFIDYREISQAEYNEKKEQAEQQMIMFSKF